MAKPRGANVPAGSKTRPDDSGAYQLVLLVPQTITVAVGRTLTKRTFAPGFYVYTGSAMAPRTIASRIAYHRRKDKSRDSYHLNALSTHRLVTIVREVSRPSVDREECQLNQATEDLPGAVVVDGFGNRDDKPRRGKRSCRGHLVWFAKMPARLPAIR